MREYYIEKTNFDPLKYNIYLSLQSHEPCVVAAPAHIHGSIEIIYVREGSYTVFLDDVEYKIFAGDVILFRSNAIHHTISGMAEKNSYYVLKVKPEVIYTLADPSNAGVYALNFAVNHFSAKSLWTKAELEGSDCQIRLGFQTLIREFDEETAFSDVALRLAVGSILLGMMRSGAMIQHEGLEVRGEVVEAIYRAVVHINSHYAEKISAKQLCLLTGMSYSFFSRSFKEITGKNFKEYLNMIRVNQAERLLTTTDKTINEIGNECGYNDDSYFIKVFREGKGMTPGEYKLLRTAAVTVQAAPVPLADGKCIQKT